MALKNQRPKNLVKKFGSYVQESPLADKSKVVLDASMLIEIEGIECIPEKDILERYLWSITTFRHVPHTRRIQSLAENSVIKRGVSSCKILSSDRQTKKKLTARGIIKLCCFLGPCNDDLFDNWSLSEKTYREVWDYWW